MSDATIYAVKVFGTSGTKLVTLATALVERRVFPLSNFLTLLLYAEDVLPPERVSVVSAPIYRLIVTYLAVA